MKTVDDQVRDRLWFILVYQGKDAFLSECKNYADALSLDPEVAMRPNAGMCWRY